MEQLTIFHFSRSQSCYKKSPASLTMDSDPLNLNLDFKITQLWKYQDEVLRRASLFVAGHSGHRPARCSPVSAGNRRVQMGVRSRPLRVLPGIL